jgi:hypothetical protein
MEKQTKMKLLKEDHLIQKLHDYGLAYMSGPDIKCGEVLDEIVQMFRAAYMVETKLPEARAKVFDAIGTERHYQELKWGPLEQHPQSVGAYLTLMRVHLADAEAAWARSSGDVMALDRIRRVLAIGVACGEQHGMPRRLVPAPLPPATCDQISRTADILEGFETIFRQAAGETFSGDEHE